MNIFSAILSLILITTLGFENVAHAGPLSSGSDSALPSAPWPVKNYKGPFELPAVEGGRASAKVFLPNQYEEKDSFPLVVLLHGFTGTADFVDTYLTMRYRASSRGFILLTPEGTPTPAGTLVDGVDVSGKQFWNATDFCCDAANTGVDDVTYLKNLIQEVKAKYKVDQKRVYIFGHSNGGFMANRLACEMGEDIAAIASLAGGSFADSSDCKRPAPITYLQIHAINDHRIAYSADPQYAGGGATVKQWAQRNGCSGSHFTSGSKDYLLLIPGDDTSEAFWNDCSSGKDLEFWTIKDYKTKYHNPHIPLFNLNFTDAVLDFLFRYSQGS